MIKHAEYIKSIVDLKDQPESFSEILMIGRSNVGKSSFINALTHKKNLARVSKTPGKTLTLNYYLLDHSFYLVDAPGYGYARRSKSMKDAFVMMIEQFILNSKHLKLICLLVDFKVGPTDDDLFTYDFLVKSEMPVMVIATKKDKIPRTHQNKQEKKIKALLREPEYFMAYSNVTKEKLVEIEDIIRKHI